LMGSHAQRISNISEGRNTFRYFIRIGLEG